MRLLPLFLSKKQRYAGYDAPEYVTQRIGTPLVPFARSLAVSRVPSRVWLLALYGNSHFRHRLRVLKLIRVPELREHERVSSKTQDFGRS